MKKKPLLVDAHCHLDTINPDLLRKDVYYISWSFAGNKRSMEEIYSNLKDHAEIIRNLNAQGFSCGWLAGVHPRSVSDDFEISAIPEMILPFLDDEFCLGVGEVGVETNSIIERNLFLSHLSLCDEVRKKNKIIGVHLPSDSKYDVAVLTDSLLSGFSAYKDLILVDHLDASTIAGFLDKGFYAGITLNENKLTLKDLEKIQAELSKDNVSRLIVSSDSYQCLSAEYTAVADMNKGSDFFYKNAMSFFKL